MFLKNNPPEEKTIITQIDDSFDFLGFNLTIIECRGMNVVPNKSKRDEIIKGVEIDSEKLAKFI